MAMILLTVTSSKVSVSGGGGGHQEAVVAVGECVGAEDAGHPIHRGAALSPVTRGLMVTITSTRPPGADMSPDDVAHARGHHSLVITSLGAMIANSEGTILPSPSSILSDSQLHFHTLLSFPDKSHVSREMTGISVMLCESWRLQVTRPGGCCHSVTVCHLPPHTLPELPAVQN